MNVQTVDGAEINELMRDIAELRVLLANIGKEVQELKAMHVKEHFFKPGETVRLMSGELVTVVHHIDQERDDEYVVEHEGFWTSYKKRSELSAVNKA